MKNLKKTTFFIVIMFIACFFILSIFGVKSRWGDTIRHHFKGCDTIKWGSDVEDSMAILLNYEEGLSEDDMDRIEETISKRLNLMGIGGYSVYFDRPKNLVKVIVPESASKPNFDLTAIAENLAIVGNLKLTLGGNKDDFFAKYFKQKSDPSKNELIGDDTNIVSSDVTYRKNRFNMLPFKNIPSMKFVLDENTKQKFVDIKKKRTENKEEIKKLEELVKKEKEQKKEEQKNESENPENKNKEQKSDNEKKLEELKKEDGKKLELFLDGETIYSGDLASSFNESDDLEVQNFEFPTSTVLNIVNTVSSGKLPTRLNVLDVRAMSPALGRSYKLNILIFLGILLILVLAYIFLKYKFFGFVAVVCILGHFSFVVACFTGFFSFLPGVFVNMPAIFGAACSLILGVLMFTFLLNKISSKINEKNSMEFAVKRTFKENSKLIVRINMLIMLISLIVMSMFGAQKNDLFSNIFQPLTSLLNIGAQDVLFSFSYAAFFGTAGSLIFQYLTPKFLLKSLSGFKYFRNSKIYGGKVK